MSDNKQTENSPVISEKRRKLLKASAATPLIATLTLGSGQAAATSAYQCASNNINPTTSEFTTTTDSFVRVSARKYTTNNAGDNNGSPSPIYEILPPQSPPVYRNKLGAIVTPNLNHYNAPVDGYVLNVYDPEPTNIQPTEAVEKGPWPEFQLTTDDYQPLYQSCATSIPIIINNGSIV